MIKRIFNLFMLSIALMGMFTLSGTTAYAQKSAVCEGAGAVESGSDCKVSGVEVEVDDVLRIAVNILSWTAGVIAVIMVILSAIKYITSGGDSGKVASAKKTLIYALVGAALASISQVVIRAVVNSFS